MLETLFSLYSLGVEFSNDSRNRVFRDEVFLFSSIVPVLTYCVFLYFCFRFIHDNLRRKDCGRFLEYKLGAVAVHQEEPCQQQEFSIDFPTQRLLYEVARGDLSTYCLRS